MRRLRTWAQWGAVSAVAICLVFASGEADGKGRSSRRDPNAELRRLFRLAGVHPLDAGPEHSPEKIALGQALFFDKILSGNRDIACATCHHPVHFTGDDLSLPIGTGGVGLGPERIIGPGRHFVPRNAPEVFNRGSILWHTQFWDMRLEEGRNGGFITPAGDQLPPGLESVLAAQAMFPVTSRDEMRGSLADAENPAMNNELALIDDTDFTGMWDALMVRLLSIPEYVAMFEAAYDGVPVEELGFQHAANAIAAFEATAFSFFDSPFDRYVASDARSDDLSDDAKQGAILFYGEANCSRCHAGALLTDQAAHNIGIPQLGPGKAPEAPLDFGRARETGNLVDFYAFRTPPLRNVEVTGPWMHNGAYTELEAAVRHHLNAAESLRSYDGSQIVQPGILETLQTSPVVINDILRTLDLQVRRPVRLSDREIGQLMAFLSSLTSDAVASGSLLNTIPPTVPSGLPVDGVEYIPVAVE